MTAEIDQSNGHQCTGKVAGEQLSSRDNNQNKAETEYQPPGNRVNPPGRVESWMTKVQNTAPNDINAPASMARTRVDRASMLPLVIPAFSTRAAICAGE